MALVKTQTLAAQFQGFSGLPAVKQLGLMVGLAASIALGVAVVLWSQEPNHSLLYAGVTGPEMVQVTEALDQAQIPYRLQQGGSAILVPSAQVDAARLKLAAIGLPKGRVTGLEFLDQGQPLGTSRLIERARYQRALAGELSRSIATLDSVRSARVHLAMPKRSVFLRNRIQPSASVLLDLYPGRGLDDTQIAGITYLVASSIPELEPEQVSIVDHKGRLLTAQQGSSALRTRAEHFKLARSLEQSYSERIMAILAPIVGLDGVRAQVSAQMDFTTLEETREDYGPDPKAVRSEQIRERRREAPDAGGVPGALSNQPPAAGTLGDPSADDADKKPVTTSLHTTRNYELDRVLSHSRTLPGSVKRLSVAVVVDYRTQTNERGEVERVALDAKQMEYITSLVKQAVGFDERRGDSVNVINASFLAAAEAEPLEPTPIWEQAWLVDMVKQGLGVLLVLVLGFGVLRPVLKGLAERGNERGQLALPAGAEAGGELPLQQDQLTLTNQQAASAQGAGAGPPDLLQQHLDHAKALVKEDPKRVAQVVKTWLTEDDS
jgi:flagellar M-ring protein FliF